MNLYEISFFLCNNNFLIAMYFILKNKTDDLKSKTNSRPFSNKIEKKVSRISRPQNFKTKNKNED